MIPVFGRQLAGGSLCLGQPGEIQASQGLIMRPPSQKKEREGGKKRGREGRKGKGEGKGEGKKKEGGKEEGRRILNTFTA